MQVKMTLIQGHGHRVNFKGTLETEFQSKILKKMCFGFCDFKVILIIL